MCSSTGGSITGKGANIIFIDDPTDPQRAFSEVERDKSIRYFAQTLSTRLNRPDIDMFFIIMQRLHENDLTGWLIANMPDAFEVISIPATSEGNIIPSDLIRFYKDGLFFPDRFSKEVVSNLRLSLGMYGYSGQMEQQPAPVEGGMIKKTYFKIIDSAPQQINWNYTIDGAYTENEKNDPTAILAYGMKDGNMYICNVESVWMEFPDLMKEVVRFTQWNGYSNRSRIFIEPKASGLPAVQTLKRETMLNVIADKPPTTDKITRVNACLPFLESGRVILIRGAWNDSFIHQCCTFPNATHDDEVDCLTMAISREQTNSQIISVAL
jgi:predicted phage terminase large subunit-like protein